MNTDDFYLGEKLDEAQAATVQRGFCPDCLGKLVEGPHGGLSINYHCSTPTCGSGFNDMFVFGVERITKPRPNQ